MYLEHTQFVADRERYRDAAVRMTADELLERYSELVFELSEHEGEHNNLVNDRCRQLDAVTDELSKQGIHV